MKNIFINLLLLVSLHSFAQMRVEDIHSDNDMTKFINKYYLKTDKDSMVYYNVADWARIEDTSYFSYCDTSMLQYLHSVKHVKWVKSDFNKDGRLDIVVACYSNAFWGNEAVLSFVSERNGYKATLLSAPEEDGNLYISYDHKSHYLKMGAVDCSINFDTSIHFTDRYRIDTLSYTNGLFVDYGTKKDLSSIDTLKFKIITLPNMSGSYTIVIPKKGKIQLIRLEDDSALGPRTQHLYEMDQDTIKKQAFSLAQSLPISRYHNYYRPIAYGQHDGFGINTEIIFADGTRKNINDYLGTAPIGLRYLYEYSYQLKSIDKWKFSKIIKSNCNY